MISQFQRLAFVTLASFAALPSSANAQDAVPSEWSIKPRGRVQFDAGTVSTPPGIVGLKTDFTVEIRRAFIGVDVKMPAGFALRAEVDLATEKVQFTDLFLSYKASDALTLMLGQAKPAWGLEEQTSDLFPTFTERAAFNTAFGHERQTGLGATLIQGPWLAQAGIYTSNLFDIDEDGERPITLHGRVVYMPKIGDGRLHLGASIHRRQLNNAGPSVTYRVRPFIHSTNTRFISTGAITQTQSELGLGLEAAWIKGRFHATGEARWQKADRLGALPDPTFFGGYAEVGYFLTKGDTRGYKDGQFDRVKPARPVGKGGFGAVQLNLRYDYLDLIDGPYVGGRQNGFGVGLSWHPTERTRFIANYARLNYSHAAIPATGGDRDYGIDAFGIRAQIDF